MNIQGLPAAALHAVWPALLLISSVACTGLLNPAEAPGTSRDFEPPPAWGAGVTFLFQDSAANPSNAYGASVEVMDGAGGKVVATGRDLFRTEGGEVRTPWYRMWPGEAGEYVATVRITIGDAARERTVATYPLVVKKDHFYYVSFGIATFDRASQRPTNPSVFDLRSYPVPAGARRAPGDSLWVSWVHRTRYCFDCPT